MTRPLSTPLHRVGYSIVLFPLLLPLLLLFECATIPWFSGVNALLSRQTQPSPVRQASGRAGGFVMHSLPRPTDSEACSAAAAASSLLSTTTATTAASAAPTTSSSLSSAAAAEVPYGQWDHHQPELVTAATAAVVAAAAPRPTTGTYSARFLEDNGLELALEESTGRVTARPRQPVVVVPAAEEDNHHVTQLETTTTTTANGAAAATTAVAATVSTTTPLPAVETPLLSTDTAADDSAPILPPPHQEQEHHQHHHPHAKAKPPVVDHPAIPVPQTGFNVVLTHCTADFDSLASAVALAKLWSAEQQPPNVLDNNNINPIDDNSWSSVSSLSSAAASAATKSFDSASHVPTFVVLPRGAHPSVQRFLALHKHLFPIRSLKSLPPTGLHRLALVDAQRRERLGPAAHLLAQAQRITVVDHHVDQDSDIAATDYVVDKVGSVTTLMVERLQAASQHGVTLTEAEATLLALGIHADTGSLVFDSTTPRDAFALAWCLSQGASQAAIAEHARSSLSPEQQGVLTQALLHVNTTVFHGVTVSTVLLTADGFIQGLAAVTQDAMELSSSDVFLMGLVYDASGGSSSSGGGGSNSNNNNINKQRRQELVTSRLLTAYPVPLPHQQQQQEQPQNDPHDATAAEMQQQRILDRLRAAFDRHDVDGSGYLDRAELVKVMQSTGTVVSSETMQHLFDRMDVNGNGQIEFEELVQFVMTESQLQQAQQQQSSPNESAVSEEKTTVTPASSSKKNSSSSSSSSSASSSHPSWTLILIGRVKAGTNLKAVRLNRLLEPLGGGGHAKAASATVRVPNINAAAGVLQKLVDDLLSTALPQQPTVGDFMTSPVLSVQPTMTEQQVEDLFTRYDVRALPVVDEEHNVVGLVTYKEVAAAKQRLWNKEQQRLRKEAEQAQAAAAGGNATAVRFSAATAEPRKPKSHHGTMVKGWMKQHIQTIEASKTMAELESLLLETDVGCIPVVADGTKKLVGMVTRTDLLRQHRYYPSLPYHNKGFADSIAARQPIIALRKRLKRFDLE